VEHQSQSKTDGLKEVTEQGRCIALFNCVGGLNKWRKHLPEATQAGEDSIKRLHSKFL
jgi:hypothetical protein